MICVICVLKQNGTLLKRFVYTFAREYALIIRHFEPEKENGMKKGMIMAGCAVAMACSAADVEMAVKAVPVRPKEKTALFNGKDFSGWTKVINHEPGSDPDTTWTVQDGLIHCTGTPFGYLRTQQSYADFKLHVEYRWADTTTESPNSGIFTFTTGPDNFFLPKAVEAQLKMGSAGDFVLLSQGTLEGIQYDGVAKGVPKKEASSEKPRGEWNSVDIVTLGNTIEVNVNGVLQNTGKDVYTDAGQICLQSEGGAIQFRNIVIGPATGPEKLTIALDVNGGLALNDKVMGKDELDRSLAALDTTLPILIKCKTDVSKERMIEVLDLCVKQGFEKVSIFDVGN